VQEAAYDAELQLGLAAQKRLREQLLRQKEMRRQMQAQERRHDGTSHAQQQQQQQPATMAPVTGMSTVAATEFLKPYYRPLRAFGALTLLVGWVPGRSSGL